MPEAHFSWRDAGVMRASLLLSAGNLMCEAQDRCALSAEKEKAPEIFRFQVLSYCKWRTDYRAVWRGNGNRVCRDADIFKRCTQNDPPHVGGRLPDGGSLRRASSAQKLSPRGRRTERQLAHSQGHENNCREAFPPIPSDKRRQFVSQSGGGSCSHGSFRTNRLPAPRDFST